MKHKRLLSALLLVALVLSLPGTAVAGKRASESPTSQRVRSTVMDAPARLASGVSAAEADDDIPGVDLPASPFSDAVDDVSDIDDVYKVPLVAGETLTVQMTGPAEADFDLYLYGLDATSVNTDIDVARSENDFSTEVLIFKAPADGTYYLDVWAGAGTGPYTLTWKVETELVSDDEVPGVPLPVSPFDGLLNEDTDYDDVFYVDLTPEQSLTVSMTGAEGTDFDLYLWKPGTPTVNPVEIGDWLAAESKTENSSTESFTYQPSAAGTYYLDVYAWGGSGSYSITWANGAPPDKTAPTVSNKTPVYSSKLTKVAINALDTGGSGVKQVEYKINGVLPATIVGGSTATASLTKLGNNKLEYRAKDNADNYSAWKSVTVAVKYTSLSHTAPTTCTYASAKLYGYLKYANSTGAMTPLSGKTVSVQQYKSGSWVTIGTDVTSSTGRWDYTAKPTARASYRAYYAGTTTYLKQTSANKTVLPKVYFSSAPKFSTYTHTYGKTYTVWGYVKPKHSSGSEQIKVKAYKKGSDGAYHYVKTFYTKISNPEGSSYSKYKGYVKLPSKGKWRLRAYHAEDSTNASSYSSYRYVEVK